MRSTRSIEKFLEGLKKAVFPDRYKEEAGKIYGLVAGEWQELADDEIENLKESFKAQNIENLRAFKPGEIEVKIVKDGEEEEKPLRSWPDGYYLYPDGFKQVIYVKKV